MIDRHDPIRALLVEDDPDDYVLTRDLLAEAVDAGGAVVELEWARSCEAGLAALSASRFDVVLLDYHLGAETGLDFLRRMPANERTPVILLTGQPDRDTDLEAMRAGAAEYLVKAEITPTLLERSIRYIAERRRAEEALRDREEVLRQITENIREVFWMFNADFTETIYVSGAYEEIWGYPKESLYADAGSFLSHVHPDDREPLLGAMRTVRTRPLEGVEYRIIRSDGSLRWVMARGTPVRDERGEVYRIVGTTEDITERKQTQAKLFAAEAHYRRLVENAPYSIFALDENGRFTEFSPATEIVLGLSPGELLGKFFSDLILPEDLPAAKASLHRKLSGEVQTGDLEVRVTSPSGERRLIHVRSTAIHENGKVVGVHGIARDVTEERARDHQMRLLATALEGLQTEAVGIADASGRFVYANAAHARILGYDPARREEISISAFLPDGIDAEEQREILAEVDRKGSWSGQIRRRRVSDGEVLILDAVIGRVQDAEEDRVLYFSILADATGRIRQERHLRRAERLASVGTLLSGVAHELNNPLHAITNFAELLLEDPRPAEEREDLETIRREAERMAKIVSSLRLIARETQEDGEQRKPVDVNEVIRHVVRLREYALRTSNIEVRPSLANDLPHVWADRAQIEQVLLNLVVNAEQAMGAHRGEGCLVLRTLPTHAGVRVYVTDNGPGIPAEHLERIFDPFWTTKDPGEGTGLGLSLVHNIISEHEGELHLESQVGSGTTFAIDLPRAPTEVRSPVATPGSAPAQPLRVLVVDDEPALRRSLQRFLGRRGHRVDVAGEGREALRMVDEAGKGGYDVILSDLKMPGLGGEQLLMQLQARHAGMERRIVFLTGNAAGEDAARLLSRADVSILLKPVQLEELARVLEEHAASSSEDAVYPTAPREAI